jgi:hypothetical protein
MKSDEKKNNIINDYSNKSFLKTISSGTSIFTYKIGIIWIPLLLYLITIIIYFIINSNITDTVNENNSFYSKLKLSFIGGFTIFIYYFIIDIVYQNAICNNTSIFKLISNSFYNAFYVSISIVLGYMIAYWSHSQPIETENILYLNLSNHRNNIFLSIIFYIYIIFYINPLIYKEKRTRSNLC